jgi:hypothetical protein
LNLVSQSRMSLVVSYMIDKNMDKSISEFDFGLTKTYKTQYHRTPTSSRRLSYPARQ